MTTQNHRSRRTVAALAVALVALLSTACLDSDEPITVDIEGEDMFLRYVSLGNSITAGFQSGGLTAAMQRQAYPVLLAGKAGASFGIPTVADPGCPPPLVGPLTTQRTSTVACGLRSLFPPDLVQNLAVPGANTMHVTEPTGTGSPLNSMILGGRTQADAMVEAEPTLVSVWIGNNDALSAALGGDTLALTPMAAFQSEYDELVSAIQSTDAQDAILIGVANPMVVAPALQPGAYFWALAQSPPPGLPDLNVSSNCAPFDGSGSPNPGGARLVSFVAVAAQIAAGMDPIVIDCGPNAPGLLNETEMATIATRIAMFNGYIQQQAADNGWIYIDPAAFIMPALSDPNQIRKCQGFATATDPASFMAAVMNTCPVDLDPSNDITFFGSFFSFDGVHPSAAAHAVVADTVAGRLNEAHGLSLPID